jgi:5S rRNA maturation endonuclease (ribonuclease M5)
MRKKAGLQAKDRVVLLIDSDEKGRAFIGQFTDEIIKVAGLSRFDWKKSEKGEEVSAGEHSFTVQIDSVPSDS